MRPPAVRGDIDVLIAERTPGTLVLADGAFDRSYAVGHRELLASVARGWRVIGVSSMGAIRAADLPGSGITGFGAAYTYLVDTGAPDDHLALVHEPVAPFRVLAEALYDVRQCVLAGQEQHEDAALEAFLSTAATWWFGDRTLDRLGTLLATHVGGGRARQLLDPLHDPRHVRAKQADLINLMKELVP